MLSANRNERRRIAALRAQGFTHEEIERAARRVWVPDADPLLNSGQVCQFVGGISQMSLWRYRRDFNFPAPDLTLNHRRFWRHSTVEAWLASRIQKPAAN